MHSGDSRMIAFFDECGDHSMEVIDRDFPLFLLSAVIVERERYVNEIIPRLNSFKLGYWDHEGVNIHSRDIRKSAGPFSMLQNPDRRRRFKNELSILMKELPYTLFVVGIHKEQHRNKYQEEAQNPYNLAVTLAFERIVHFMERSGETKLPVIAEARGKNEDRDLEAAFYRLMTGGTDYIAAERFRRLSCPLHFADKRQNVAGVQLADLCAHPAARHILKPDQPNQAFDIVNEHVYSHGNVKGWKVFP
jgi:Protein of unknown function (DUF3800)